MGNYVTGGAPNVVSAVAIGEPSFAAGRRDGKKAAASLCGDKEEREDTPLILMRQEVHGFNLPETAPLSHSTIVAGTGAEMRHMAPLCPRKGRDAEFPPKTDLGPPRCASPAGRSSTLKSAPAAQTHTSGFAGPAAAVRPYGWSARAAT
ncbi:hypothetical protein HPB52_022519 [Rhipicephalus sanguineus]|uniref:Uncharacterized protein n=1 Tax=Rhipicephalus sanguineus TaxID=34632 RepID=A0A9D4PYW3_RHISA|nr:hypothetical protein HPB52_022519 [Rhipicephalus sanguineus]